MQIDATQYFVAGDGEAKGPYTLGQLIQLWRSGSINAATQFWTEADDRWRPLLDLQLDAPDAETANTRVIRVLDPATSVVTGPFSPLDLEQQMQQGTIGETHKFWWPGISHWIDFGVFHLSLQKDPYIEQMLSDSLTNTSQLEPPPLGKQWTISSQAVSGVATFVGAAIAIIVVLVILFFLFAAMAS